MPSPALKSVPQQGFDEQVIEDEDIEAALEEREKRRASARWSEIKAARNGPPDPRPDGVGERATCGGCGGVIVRVVPRGAIPSFGEPGYVHPGRPTCPGRPT